MNPGASSESDPKLAPAGRWAVGLLCLGLFLVVLGGRSMTIGRFGSDLPYWDQWDAGADHIVLPYLRGELDAGDFLRPHNEHRVVWTKALSLALLLANGRWDVRLETVVNAMLVAGLGVTAFAVGGRILTRSMQVCWALALAFWLAPPIAWQTTVGGFHSQQYLLLGFSIAAIVGLLTSAPIMWRWWLGVAFAAAALVTMGGGFLAALAVAIACLPAMASRDGARRTWPTVATCAAFVIMGWLARVEVAHHAPLRAASLDEFFAAFWHQVQWPVFRHRWFPLLAWLPWVVHACRTTFRRAEATPVDRALLGVGLWILGMFAATAYARGAAGAWPVSRYVDVIIAGTLLNVLLLLREFARRDGSRAWRRFWLATAALAALAYVPAYARQLRENVAMELVSHREQMDRVEANLRGYLATDDVSWLNQPDRAHPNPAVLVECLRDPRLRALLPASVQSADDAADAARAPGTVAARWIAGHGEILVALGALSFLVGGGLMMRRNSLATRAQRAST